MEKALREAKRTTSWVAQDAAWEGRVLGYCRALYEHAPFRAAFEPFAERLAAAGERHALRQTALKLTVPGVPDVYQGDELVALSLVDPDNRRPVDWARRRALLDELAGGAPPADADARKLFLIRELLALRARRPEAFAGGYEPLDAGPGAVAFLRGDEVAVAMPVREGGLDTLALELPRGTWRPAFDADLLPGAQITALERT
jgi:(1->4)-alpha-D-glucan 1-alpha-D-glucosylmutase